VGENPGTAFGINLTTGVLFVANRNALLLRNSIPVTVKVTDNGPGNLSATATITVNVVNTLTAAASPGSAAGSSGGASQGTLAAETISTPAAARVAPAKRAGQPSVTDAASERGPNQLLERALSASRNRG